MVVGLVLILVVGFFAFQWWSGAGRKSAAAAAAKKTPAPTTIGGPMPSDIPAPMNQKPTEEKYPEVAGQTEKELRAKEPAQRPIAATNPQAVTYAGEGPAKIPNNLRRPEQAFHQPPQEAGPALKISEVASGRAAAASSPQSGFQQPFSPEFAQNGGAMIGNSVFAYDGMEPNDFSSF